MHRYFRREWLSTVISRILLSKNVQRAILLPIFVSIASALCRKEHFSITVMMPGTYLNDIVLFVHDIGEDTNFLSFEFQLYANFSSFLCLRDDASNVLCLRANRFRIICVRDE